jgi:hypothetical protein
MRCLIVDEVSGGVSGEKTSGSLAALRESGGTNDVEELRGSLVLLLHSTDLNEVTPEPEPG